MFILSFEDTQPLSDRSTRDGAYTCKCGCAEREPGNPNECKACGACMECGVYIGTVRGVAQKHECAAVMHDLAQTDASLACRLDAIGHTVCELDKADLKVLLQLAACDRAALLSERRQYVMARRGDQSRFNELIRTLDTKIEAATKLTDKLAKLYAVQP